MLGGWALAACLGLLAWAHLGPRLSDSVEIPGSESQAASELLSERFHESDQGSLLVLFEAPASSWSSPAFASRLRSSLRRAARVVDGRASPLRGLSATASYAELTTRLSVADARAQVSAVEDELGHPPGTRVEVTGFPVISAELSEDIAGDLRRAELIALPITALILLFYFGSLTAAAIPLLFGLATISVAMGLVWLETWFVSIPVYATNVVTLVGIALAIDYSMLYVSRYREERRDGLEPAQALPQTARTAGRALTISGAVVAAGLTPLVFIPIPFFSGLGFATLVIPTVSVVAAATLLPALLRSLGPRLERAGRPGRRRSARPRRPVPPTLSGRLVDFVIDRAGPVAVVSGLALLLLSLPVIEMELAGSSSEYVNRAQLQLSGHGGGGPSIAPSEVLVDSGRAGGARRPAALTAERRLLRELSGDEGIEAIQAPLEAGSWTKALQLGLADPSGRFTRIRVAGGDPSGSREAEALVERLRDEHVPEAGLDGRARVGGAAAADYDFVNKVEASMPAVAVAIVAIMYVLLTVLLRSPVLPLKAIAMSAISVTAACGVLVALFQLGWGSALGIPEARIEAWVPILLFAALFGISTDYEVFMVTRMREEWLRSGQNERAVKTGLRLVGGMVTTSTLVMVTIFACFTASSVVALQQFGIGLVVGVVLDATVVRLFLMPSLMKLMGRWNWSFPSRHPIAPPKRAESGIDGR